MNLLEGPADPRIAETGQPRLSPAFRRQVGPHRLRVDDLRQLERDQVAAERFRSRFPADDLQRVVQPVRRGLAVILDADIGGQRIDQDMLGAGVEGEMPADELRLVPGRISAVDQGASSRKSGGLYHIVDGPGLGVDGVGQNMPGTPRDDDQIALFEEHRLPLSVDAGEATAAMGVMKPGDVLELRHLDPPRGGKGRPEIKRPGKLHHAQDIAQQIHFRLVRHRCPNMRRDDRNVNLNVRSINNIGRMIIHHTELIL